MDACRVCASSGQAPTSFGWERPRERGVESRKGNWHLSASRAPFDLHKDFAVVHGPQHLRLVMATLNSKTNRVLEVTCGHNRLMYHHTHQHLRRLEDQQYSIFG